MRLCWLSFREAAWFILESAGCPGMSEARLLEDAEQSRGHHLYEALISSAVQSQKKDTEVLAESAIVPTVVKQEGG